MKKLHHCLYFIPPSRNCSNAENEKIRIKNFRNSCILRFLRLTTSALLFHFSWMLKKDFKTKLVYLSKEISRNSSNKFSSFFISESKNICIEKFLTVYNSYFSYFSEMFCLLFLSRYRRKNSK